MLCGRRVGVWQDDDLLWATCWLEQGHLGGLCQDRALGLMWTPGSGTDSTGRRFLIDPADVPQLEDEPATELVPLLPEQVSWRAGRDARARRRARSRP